MSAATGDGGDGGGGERCDARRECDVAAACRQEQEEPPRPCKAAALMSMYDHSLANRRRKVTVTALQEADALPTVMMSAAASRS
jgi:hypothetical protein